MKDPKMHPAKPAAFTNERVACLLVKSSAPIDELAEACLRFSPQVAVRRPGGESPCGAIFLEISRCSSLYSERTLLLRLGALAQRFGCFPHISIADDAPTALAMARFDVSLRAGESARGKLPLEALHDYASPFAFDDVLHKKVLGMLVTMRMLGLERLADFAALPTKTLASRFGAYGVELSLRVQGRARAAWSRFTPPEKIVEKAELHELCELPLCNSLEPLLFVLKGLADRAMSRLRGRVARASVLQLTLELEKGRREWRLELPVPQGSSAGLLPIVRDKLAFDLERRPLERDIVRLELAVLETAPARAAQVDLFRTGHAETEAWDALVGRLRQKLGKDGAFVANAVDEYLPERAWARALEALDRLPTDLPPRPARVLRKPRPLKKEGRDLVVLRSERARDSRRWRISEWHGPERIAVEWWMDPDLQGFNRDYYRIVTEAGEQLWVYSTPAGGVKRERAGAQNYYLHGFFD